MSLEDAINKNTIAIGELTAALNRAPNALLKSVEKKTEATPAVGSLISGSSGATGSAAPSAGADEVPAFLRGKGAAKPVAAKPAAKKEAAPATPGVSEAYAPVQKAILSAVSKGHRGAVVKILAEYDVAVAQDLPEDVYDEVRERVEALCADEGDIA